ncbi:GIY-YIG nuclease family protein [Budviciaceae bacterium CWB-B4]|uniref:GIY-YIG nuclease family protein n=1 Tax=Limnobaculum xujianqingii TaxID=2738837 RepID=A0A9D7AIK2_9GAMM|nr:GIY-YIG nuclease family protein [Limnobaculum xujianqingii]MBK5073628.1 GIY-YIG nuclease family protein [Limnobaculum xujianqingii]MBK5176641.1 GIY-YIG nuclease family protein [Limnobaculum xujianqingii]
MIRLSTNHLSGKSTLNSIISEDDEFGLLDVQPLKPKSGLVNLYGNQFSEIVAYYELHGRLPTEGNMVSLDEKRLARRLTSIKENPDLCLQLRSIDFYNLLESNSSDYIHTNLAAESESPAYINKSELVTSLEDIFADDDDELLNFDEPDIFSITHVSVDRKEQPDEIAQRQTCPDFQRFEPLFLQLRGGLKNGIFSLERFTHKLKISEGDFFVLNGVVGYVHSAGERLREYSTYNARLHLIFENGTEMNMLYQSLTHGLVRDKEGRKVQLNGQKLIPSDVSVPSGLVYILATKSKDPALIPYKQNLYKIGFTETTVEQRIKNAEKDRTFLEAPVRIVAASQCFNLNAQKLEALVHGFLATRRLNITLKSHTGQVYTPKEWFNVPLATVQAVIQYVVDGTISQYRLDNTTGKIVSKR